jgi:hypothetical protein
MKMEGMAPPLGDTTLSSTDTVESIGKWRSGSKPKVDPSTRSSTDSGGVVSKSIAH